MGHSAVMEVINSLKANLIGSRIDTRIGLEKIVEQVVRKSLQIYLKRVIGILIELSIHS